MLKLKLMVVPVIGWTLLSCGSSPAHVTNATIPAIDVYDGFETTKLSRVWDTGRIKAWLDNKQIVDYTGVNAYPENEQTGFANPSRFYFKMGLYRDLMAEPMTIYFDEYRKKELRGNAFSATAVPFNFLALAHARNGEWEGDRGRSG